MMGIFAEFERAVIRERVNAGLARARALGKQLGRPRVPIETEAAIRAARADGMGKVRIAKRLGIGVRTIQRVLAEATEPDAFA
jgi:DNA invertase Pin-like site-specific DNA recombinase